MAKSQVIGFRANPDEDRDIMQALSVYNDRTYGIKELLRLGIAAKAGYHVVTGQASRIEAPERCFVPQGHIQWSPFPEDKPKRLQAVNLEDTLVGNFEDGE